MRTSVVRDLGGWSDDGLEDWDLYRRALEAGASFVCIPEVTWRYRFHDGNRTFQGTSAK
jgi:hypothetical protein